MSVLITGNLLHGHGVRSAAVMCGLKPISGAEQQLVCSAGARADVTGEVVEPRVGPALCREVQRVPALAQLPEPHAAVWLLADGDGIFEF